MDEYKVWISNYNKPNDKLRFHPKKLVESDYPSMSGKTIRVYAHARDSALDDITEQLEELREMKRLQPGDVAYLRDTFSEGRWEVGSVRVTLERSA
jgi:TATA-binding protein-associated factor Taf7